MTSASGIAGLDSVLRGGLPTGRTTIVGGGPGSGKTLLAMQFLAHGTRIAEPGLMISFEESPAALVANLTGMTLADAFVSGDGVRFVDGRLPSGVGRSGDYDVEGLIAISNAMVAKYGIKRIAIDGIDALLAYASDATTRPHEIGRILNWLTESGATGVLTMRESDGASALLPPFDLAEYAADAVIRLKSTMIGQLLRRSLFVLKLRGAGFETGEHPYMISSLGVRVLSQPRRTGTKSASFDRRLSSGIERLDRMMLGGYRAGTTTLISGLPGTSKSTLGAAFLEAGARAGERVMFVGFDEPAEQYVVDVRSIGIDLASARDSGLLLAESFAAHSAIGDEHYLAIEEMVDRHKPERIVIDPISALEKSGGAEIGDATTERLVSMIKSRGITALFTAVSDSRYGEIESTPTRISTIADTWIHLSFANRGGERNRTLTIVKSRGTGHSNQMREILLANDGIELADVYSVDGDVLVGTARIQKEQQVAEATMAASETFARELAELELEDRGLAERLRETQAEIARLAALRTELAERVAGEAKSRTDARGLLRTLRHGDPDR